MIEKTIIANYGDWDLGKTESIILAYKKMREVAASDKVLHVDKDDVCAVLEINGIKVGICSQGDPWSHQKSWLEALMAEDCIIILAACHHSGVTADRIEDCATTYDYRLYWTSNARIYEAGSNPRVAPKGMLNRFNEQWATEIANLIESWCYS